MTVMKIKIISIKLAVILPLLSLSINADAHTLRGYDNLNGSDSVQRLGFDESSSKKVLVKHAMQDMMNIDIQIMATRMMRMTITIIMTIATLTPL